jgi:hypothetical protein
MANQWLRLWHDMPTDPKFGTVARVSGEQITLVLSVYLHLMTDASRNVTRGNVTVTAEDLATALNVTDAQIEKVLAAMEGRLIEGGTLTGWEKRQPKREDSGDDETGAKSNSQRQSEKRARDKAAQEIAIKTIAKTQCHDLSRNVTTDKDKDTDTEEIPSLSESAIPPGPVDPKSIPEKPKSTGTPACPFDALVDAYESALPDLPGVTRSLFRDGLSGAATAKRWAWVLTATHEKGSKKGQRLAVTQQDGIDWFTRFFVYAAGSDFLTGANGKFSGCSLGWLVTKANFEKVLAGNYHMEKAA